MVLYSGASKSWNNGDELLKKFIGGSPDGEIEMGAETQSGHGGLRLSMQARRRLEFAEELSEWHIWRVQSGVVKQKWWSKFWLHRSGDQWKLEHRADASTSGRNGRIGYDYISVNIQLEWDISRIPDQGARQDKQSGIEAQEDSCKAMGNRSGKSPEVVITRKRRPERRIGQ